MQLAVISYPYHYHITQLAIKHALIHIEGITDVKVIWDDRTIAAPEGYIPFSSVCEIPNYIKGWYAQQVVKLNLHRVFDNDIFILDGDVVLNQHFDPVNNFYAPESGDLCKNYSAVKEILGIKQYNFINAPFMHIKCQWLADLHKHVPDINQIYYNTAMSGWQGHWPISEWELLYHYLIDVKKINKGIEPFWFKMLETKIFELEFNLNDNFVLNGKDNFSIEFYKNQGVKINTTLWNQIYGALV